MPETSTIHHSLQATLKAPMYTNPEVYSPIYLSLLLMLLSIETVFSVHLQQFRFMMFTTTTKLLRLYGFMLTALQELTQQQHLLLLILQALLLQAILIILKAQQHINFLTLVHTQSAIQLHFFLVKMVLLLMLYLHHASAEAMSESYQA